jgi:hypothetical protein
VRLAFSARRRIGMSMLRVCSEPGCTTLTLGRLCIDHEPVQSRESGEVPPPASDRSGAEEHRVEEAAEPAAA